MYNTVAELLRISVERGVRFWEIVLENEIKLTEKNEAEIFLLLDERYEIMRRSAKGALTYSHKTVGRLIEGIAGNQYSYAENTGGISGRFINTLMAYALSCSEVNASMGLICAAPTAGACGILPAVLISLEERDHVKRRTILEALLSASGIGAIVMHNATVSGAEGGCQAECGVAGAIAAAAAVQIAGGPDETAINAFCIALMNVMGLVCDPVAGLVQVPCAQRNASQAVNAIISADMALSGIASIIPADEMIEAMHRVGMMLPLQLKETSEGGMAATPAAKAIKNHIFKQTYLN